MILTISAGCGSVGSQQSSDVGSKTEEASGETGVKKDKGESADPNEKSDYVDDYVIDVQEDESTEIK